MQNTIIQTDLPSQRYWQKCEGLICSKPNQHIMANTSCQGGSFELSFFALKPCALAVQGTLRFPKLYFLNLARQAEKNAEYSNWFQPAEGTEPLNINKKSDKTIVQTQIYTSTNQD
jgi:hypothetical protein